jgi:hypothetical protein
MTRKLRDDMRLMELASTADPGDTLVLIIVRPHENTYTTEIAASSGNEGFTRKTLLDILASAYGYIARITGNAMEQ